MGAHASHRPPEARGAFHARFLDHGILPDQVKAVLDDFSAVSVAAHLGVSRQKVYELSRASTYIDQVPWRHP